MKKVLLIIIVAVLLLVGFVLALPVFFKPSLLKATKNTINKELNADVGFSDIKLSLFRNFPQASLEINDILIKGKNDFAADTVLFASALRAKMHWKSMFQKTGRSIEEIVIVNPDVHLTVDETGKNNWDFSNIEKNEESTSQPDSGKPGEDNSFELQIDNVEIRNGMISYNDIPAKLKLLFSGMNFTISGKLFNTSTLLQTNGNVKDFLLSYDNVEYISNTSLETKTLLSVEFEKKKVLIAENELLFNQLPLQLSGSIEYPTDSIFFNLLLKNQKTGFDNFLALVPPVYSDYLKDVKANGNANITSRLGGFYYEDNFPAFLLNISVTNGDIQFKGLPEKIEKIDADIRISKPQGKLDLTEINIKKAHAEIKKNPLNLTMKLSDLKSDVKFDGAFVGALNFNDLKNAMPLDSANVAGTVEANLFLKGNYSAIEKEEYDKIMATGIVMLNNFIYDSPKLTQQVIVPKGLMEFSPQHVFLRELDIKIGQSQFKLSGKVSNYLNYALKDGTLSGNLQLNSSFVNFNELLRLQKAEKKEIVEPSANQNSNAASDKNKEEEVLAVNIPENIDLAFRSKISKAVFDRVPITDMEGLISVSKGKLTLNGLNMKLLEGEMMLTGSYENTPQNTPLFDFGFEVSKLDINRAYQTMISVQRFLPVAGQSQGKINTNIKMKGQLSPDHKIIGKSVNGFGRFGTENLVITNSPVFNQLRGILKPEKLQNVAVEDFQGNFTIVNGNIDLKPFSTKVAGQETKVIGSISAENLLDMRLDFNVNRDAFGADIQNILSVLPGNEKIKVVPAGVVITGPVNEPEVKMDLSETRKTVADATKGELQNSLNKIGKGLKKLFEK